MVVGMPLACGRVSHPPVKSLMESLLSRILMPMVLVGCMALVLNPSDPETPDPALDRVVPPPVAAATPDVAEVLPEKDAEPLLLFGGYPCRSDCSEHRAGYLWASENGISVADNCDGSSAGFIEGCRVYAESRTIAVAALDQTR
jgi:hypothetical protein